MFLPLEDDAPRKRFPFFNTLIILANIAAFAYYGVAHSDSYRQFVSVHGFTPSQWTWASVFTSMFLHADPLHLFGNMLFLAVVGDNVEDRFGHITYLFFYVLCGIAAILAHALFITSAFAGIPTIGASGAVSGILGAYLVLFPFSRIKMLFFILPVRVPAFLFIGLWAAMQWLLKLQQDEGATSVAVWAHIGGFAFGFCVTLLLRLTARKPRPSKE